MNEYVAMGQTVWFGATLVATCRNNVVAQSVAAALNKYDVE